MNTICQINDGYGKAVHKFDYDEETKELFADGKLVGRNETREEAIEAVWAMWHDGRWNLNE